MTAIPTDLRYTKSHEWVRKEADGSFRVGITEHAQAALGDLVFVELPELQQNLSAGDDSGVVESVKAASDIYSPIAGVVVETNEALADTPELINQDPYGEGWIFRLQNDDDQQWEQLLDAAHYEQVIAEEE